MAEQEGRAAPDRAGRPQGGRPATDLWRCGDPTISVASELAWGLLGQVTALSQSVAGPGSPSFVTPQVSVHLNTITVPY